MSENDRSISILYEELEDRPTLPVGGAIGAPSPDGSLVVAHLYSEFSTIPAREDHEMAADGSVDFSKGHRITRGNVTRKVLATIVMSPQVADVFGKWLCAQAAVAVQARKKKGQ